MTHQALADPCPLTDRQAQLLQLIVDGNSTKQAARELGITTKTVHNHLHVIYTKLQTQTLTHAVVEAARRGIIDLRERQPPDSSRPG